MIDPRLEAEYNNRRKVPDHPAAMARWKAQSERMRATHPIADLDVPYGEGPRHRLDLFYPNADRAAPLALFIHGGYWAALDKSWFSHLASGFLANGIALAIPSYDLCPAVPLSRVVDDVRDVACFLMRRHASDIYATGHSAGGHMAAMLLATDWAALGINHRVSGCCALSGLFDLAPLIATSINDPLQLDHAEAARLSPVNRPKPDGSLHAFVGALEGPEYFRQSSAIAQAWDGRCELVPGADHFTIVAQLEDAHSPMMRTIVQAIAAGR